MEKLDVEALLSMDRETLRKTLTEANSAIESANAAMAGTRAELERARKRAGDLETFIAKLKADLERARIDTRKYCFERFVSKADTAPLREARRREGKIAKAERAAREGIDKGRKRGRRDGTANFGSLDLEEMSKGNEPIVWDLLESKTEEERSMYVRTGERSGYALEWTPPRLLVRKVLVPTYTGPSGIPEREPSHMPIQGCIAAPSLLADVCFLKVGLGVPCYRLSRNWLVPAGIPLSPQVLCKWTVGAAGAVEPAAKALSRLLRQADCVHVD